MEPQPGGVGLPDARDQRALMPGEPVQRMQPVDVGAVLGGLRLGGEGVAEPGGRGPGLLRRFLFGESLHGQQPQQLLEAVPAVGFHTEQLGLHQGLQTRFGRLRGQAEHAPRRRRPERRGRQDAQQPEGAADLGTASWYAECSAV